MATSEVYNEENTVIHGDWMQNNLPDKSVQLIIADPPYFEVKGDFDFIWKSFDDYLKDVERWAIECKRIMADNGTLFWWGMDRKIAYAQVIFDKYFELLGTLVWEKPSIANEWDTRRTFPERGQERILMYSNEIDKTGLELIHSGTVFFNEIKKYLDSELKKSGYNQTTIKEVLGNHMALHYFGFSEREKTQFALPTQEHYAKLQSTGFFQKPYEALRQEYEALRQEYEALRKEYEAQRRPFNNFMKLTDVLNFSKVINAKHPTQKPETLTRALILTCSRPNDLVFAPFAGSGTEVAMAIREGRRAIGYDIEKKYVDMANNRVNKEKTQLRLF
jgi:site-specific DNA-methyltransferase (adenine-specific)